MTVAIFLAEVAVLLWLGGFAMTNMIVAKDHKALLAQSFHKPVVAANVFAHTVGNLQHGDRFRIWGIDPTVNTAFSIGTCKSNIGNRVIIHGAVPPYGLSVQFFCGVFRMDTMGFPVNDFFHLTVFVDREEMNPRKISPDLMEHGVGIARHATDHAVDFIFFDIVADGAESMVGVQQLHDTAVLCRYIKQVLNRSRIRRIFIVLKIDHIQVTSGDIGNQFAAADQSCTAKLIGDQNCSSTHSSTIIDFLELLVVWVCDIFHRISPICCQAAYRCGKISSYFKYNI